MKARENSIYDSLMHASERFHLNLEISCFKCERKQGSPCTSFPEEVLEEIVEKDKMTDEQRQQYLDSLFEEYHNLDYEDVIAGGILTRFKYT